jgi:hypothetical protein
MHHTFLLLFSLLESSSAASYLDKNQLLTPGQSLISPNGMNSFVFQTDGNMCAYSKDSPSPYWCTNVLNDSPKYLMMQGDCNLVAYDTASVPYWASGFYPTYAAFNCIFTIQDDKNVLVKDEYTGFVIWSCGCVPKDSTESSSDQGGGSTAHSGNLSTGAKISMIVLAAFCATVIGVYVVVKLSSKKNQEPSLLLETVL